MKKLLINTFFITSFFLAKGSADTFAIGSKKNTPNIAFVSGLDGVLIKKDWLVITKNLSKFFWNASNRMDLLKLACQPHFWQDCYKAFFHKIELNSKRLRHTNHNIEYLASKYRALAPHQKNLIEIFNEPKLITSMVQLYLLLKLTTKYPLFLATSKNSQSLKITKEKLIPVLQKEQDISWNEFFSGTFNEDKSFDKENKKIHFTKPDADYFLALWKYLIEKKGLPPDTKLIFIDEHPHHIFGATKAASLYNIPIIGIEYKNLEQIQDAIRNILKEYQER